MVACRQDWMRPRFEATFWLNCIGVSSQADCARDHSQASRVCWQLFHPELALIQEEIAGRLNMGLFDEVAGGLLKHVFSGQDAQGGMLEVIMGLLKGSESGGVQGLVETFNEKGLGEVMSSWIGKGENLPISAEQIQQVLGSAQIQQIAEKLGVSTDDASSGLAEMLPQIVDKLTPEGSLPTQDLLHQGLDMIADKLFGK
jgi:uncharacterized protein YidB (DUF937 family)